MALNINSNIYAGVLTPGLSALATVAAVDLDLFQIGLTNSDKVRFTFTSSEAILQDLSSGLCALVDSGDQSQDYINLSLSVVGAQVTRCRSDLYSTDFGDAQKGYIMGDLNENVLNSWATEMANKFSNSMENLRWSGDTASLVPSLAYHDGIVKLVQAASPYVAITNETGYRQPTTTTITLANVVDQIKLVIMAVPSVARRNKGFKCVVAPQVADLLEQALAVASGYNNNLQLVGKDYSKNLLTSNFFGYPIYIADGLGATTANSNVVIAGILEDSSMGVFKLGINKPSDEKTMMFDEPDGIKSVRMMIASSQMVGVIPNLSQVSMNA